MSNGCNTRICHDITGTKLINDSSDDPDDNDADIGIEISHYLLDFSSILFFFWQIENGNQLIWERRGIGKAGYKWQGLGGSELDQASLIKK